MPMLLNRIAWLLSVPIGDGSRCVHLSGRILALVPIAVLLAGAASSSPGAVELPAVSNEDLEPDSSVLENPSFDLLVLEIEDVRGGGPEPLEATVRISEVLRGGGEAGGTAIAKWDWLNSDGQKKYRRPEPGTRFLAAVISGKALEGADEVSIVRTFAASPENLEIARLHMAERPLSPWPVLLMPVVGWTFIALAKNRSSASQRAVLVVLGVVSTLVTLGLYYNYERHMSSYYTIRLDLLLVAPAVCAALILPAGAWWLIYRRNSRTNDAK